MLKNSKKSGVLILISSSTLKFDIIDRINEPKEKELNILEFDCGLGATLLKLKYMYPNAKLYGI